MENPDFEGAPEGNDPQTGERYEPAELSVAPLPSAITELIATRHDSFEGQLADLRFGPGSTAPTVRMAANMTDREFYAAHALLVAFHRMPSASREVQVEEAFRLADLMLER